MRPHIARRDQPDVKLRAAEVRRALKPARDDRYAMLGASAQSPTTSDPDYSDEESAFLAACERYREHMKLRFLRAVDYLAVAKLLGYERRNAP